MFNKYFVLLLLGVALVTGCIDPRWEGDEHVISIQPLYPQAGEKVVIRYNQRHQDARYKSDTLLYATLRTTSNTEGWRDFRMVMKRSPHDSAQWETTFVVPTELTGFGITIAPSGTIVSNETYATPVYTGHKPVCGAIPVQITTAKTLDEALVLFRKDAELYPHAYDRWCQLWIGKIKSGFNKDSVLSEVDSVENELHKTTLSNNDRVVGLSACACAYSLLGKWDKARSLILRMKPLCQDPLPFSAATALELMTGAIDTDIERNNSMSSKVESYTPLIQDIADITTKTHNLFLARVMMTHIDSSKVVENPAYRSVVSMVVQDIGSNRHLAISNAMLCSTVIDVLVWQKRYAEAVDAGTKFINFLNDVNDWPAFGIQQAVDVFPYTYVKTSIRYRTAKAELAGGDTAGAVQRLMAIVHARISGAFTEGPLYRSCVDLAAVYMSINCLDSAEKYCAYAGRYDDLEKRSHLAQSVLDTVNKLRKRSSAQATLAHLLVKYNIDSNATTHYAGMRIQTSRGVVTIDSTDRTQYLFFVDEQCSICKEIVPVMLSMLVNKGVALQNILLLSENTMEQIHAGYGSRYPVATLTSDLRKTFSIAAFPTLVVVKHGIGVFRRDGISAKTLDELSGTL